MRVTRFNYPLEKSLIAKADLIVDRISSEGKKKDALMLCEGGEGEGKTTMSIALAYYIAEQSGREFSHKNLYFDVANMIPIAQKTYRGIFIWDEPALQALSTDWAKTQVKDLMRLVMMVRKRQHLFFINMTKFHKFPEYLSVDRANGMIHVYERSPKDSQQRFIYIPEKKLESLWRDFRFKKKRNYKKYASKICRGTFPDILNPKYKYNVLSHFDIDDYEKRKDEAIMKIGKKDEKGIAPLHQKWIMQRNLAWKILNEKLNISQAQILRYYEENDAKVPTKTLNDALRTVAIAK